MTAHQVDSIIRELDHLIAFRRQDLIGRIRRLAAALDREADLLTEHPADIPNGLGIVQAAGYEIDALAGAVAALYEARSVALEQEEEGPDDADRFGLPPRSVGGR